MAFQFCHTHMPPVHLDHSSRQFIQHVSFFQTLFLLCLEFETLSPNAQTRTPSMMEVTLNLKHKTFFPSVSVHSKLVISFRTMGIFVITAEFFFTFYSCSCVKVPTPMTFNHILTAAFSRSILMSSIHHFPVTTAEERIFLVLFLNKLMVTFIYNIKSLFFLYMAQVATNEVLHFIIKIIYICVYINSSNSIYLKYNYL